jgi:hypothetical protein
LKVVVEAALEAFGWSRKHELLQRDVAGAGEEVGVVDRPQGWEVMAKDSDEFGGMPSCVPGGEGFGICWGKLVDFIGVTVRDAMDGISNGSDEWDEEGREGCFGVVAEAQAATLKWEVGEKKGKLRERGVGVGYSLEQQIVGGL